MRSGGVWRLDVTRPRGRDAFVRIAVLAVLAAAFGQFAYRFPGAVGDFQRRQAANIAKGDTGRLIGAADALQISNEFAVQALNLIPSDAAYAVVGPSPARASKFEISATTQVALLPYMQYLLLPRRQVPPDRAAWVLCYGCDLGSLGRKADPRWSDGRALVIAKLR